MDFISIATEHHRFLRFLDEMLGVDDTDSTVGVVDNIVTTGSSNLPQQQQLSSSSSSSSSYSNSYTTAEYGMERQPPQEAQLHTKPIFSKSAEGELFLLATNFLLYVALVIVVILVCRIYFPELLIARTNSTNTNTTNTTSTTTKTTSNTNATKYRVANEQIKTDDDDDDEQYYDTDADDEDDDEDDYGNEDEDEDDVLGHNNRNNNNNNNFSSLEFQQESLSRKQVLQRLIFCCIMLNVTFVLWGALQERMLTRRYPRFTGEYFVYSYALVFTNRFWTLIMSGMLMIYLRPKRSQSIVIYEFSFPSISNMLSSWCQYEALRYVSFPATTLFKSFKLAPVMAMGKILGNKTYPQYDYVVALMIGVGIAMFMTSTDDLRFGFDYLGQEISTAWTGIMLLVFFLFFDSFTSQFQSRMFQRHQDLSMVELMFMTSAFSTVLSFVTLLHTQELYPALNFVMVHSEIHLHFLLFSICSTIGQLLIFYTIKNFGAVVFTLIMTTRILLSIALSCIMYGHQVSATGFFGLMLVLSAVLYRIRKKAQGQHLIKWQGMEDDTKAYELVQEWHEHVDM